LIKGSEEVLRKTLAFFPCFGYGVTVPVGLVFRSVGRSGCPGAAPAAQGSQRQGGWKMDTVLDRIRKDPYAEFLGIQVEKAGKGYALCSVVIRKEMFNFLGVIHGGFLFSLADVAFAAASNTDFLPSLALDVSGSFFRTARLGDKISAEARVIHTTKRTGVYSMKVMNGSELIAMFSGTVFRKINE
jgi:acyl-CoA thioesterase